MNSAQFVRLLDKRLTDVSDQEAKLQELSAMIPKLFNVVSSDSAFEEFFYTTGVGDIPAFNGKITYLEVFPGFHKKIEHKEYAGGLQAERKLIEDKKYGVLDNRAEQLMRAAYRTQEKAAARAFTNAGSTAFDFMTSEEGKALCSSTHLTKAGVSTTTGFDNTGASAISKTALSALRLKARKLKTDIGERYQGWDNIGVVTPDNLADTAFEIVNSTLDPTSANNTVNMSKGRYQVIPYMRLDDSDTNDYYLVDLDGMKDNLVWFNRVKPESKNTVDWDTYNLLQAIYFRSSYGWKDWRWIMKATVS
jgi:phage major head subunit gpT-like protein